VATSKNLDSSHARATWESTIVCPSVMKRDTRRRLCRVNDGGDQLTETEVTRIKLFLHFGFAQFFPP
jgi:hypothetical protein